MSCKNLIVIFALVVITLLIQSNAVRICSNFNVEISKDSPDECQIKHSRFENYSVTKKDGEIFCYIDQEFSENCTSVCKSSNCNGDNNYCKNKKCNENHECYCKKEKINTKSFVDCGEGWFESNSFETKTLEKCVDYSIDDSGETSDSSFEVLNSVEENGSIELDLMIKEEIAILKNLKTASGIHQDVVFEQPSSEIKRISMNTRNLQSVSIKDKIVYEKQPSLTITREEYCSLGYCEFCDSGYYCWFKNQSLSTYLYIISILVSLLIMICYGPRFLSWSLDLCIKVKKLIKREKGSPLEQEIKEVIKDKVRKTLGKKKKQRRNDEFEDVEIIEIKEEDKGEFLFEQIPELKGKNRVFKYNNDGSFKIRSALFLCIMILPFLSQFVNSQCTGNVNSQSQIYSCVNFNTTHRECSTLMNLDFNLFGTGSKTCVQVLSNSSAVIGNLTIDFLNVEAIASLSHQYTTSNWEGLFKASRSCRWTGCAKNVHYTTCQSYIKKSLEDPNPCGQLTFEGQSYPGESSCLPSCGCAACGCFKCEDALNFHRAAIKPIGNMFDVAVSTGIEYVANLKVTWTVNKQTKTVTVSSKSPIIDNSDFKANLKGVFLSYFPDLSFTKFVSEFDSTGKLVKTYAGKANEPNQLVAENFGDIQAANRQSMINKSFKIPAKFYTATASRYGSTAVFIAQGAKQLSYLKPLPTSISGLTWTKTNSGLSAYVSNTGSASINIQFKQPWKFFQMQDLMCPNSKFISLTGCHSCDESADLIIGANSDCLEGTCTISAKNSTIFPNTLYLKRAKTLFKIKLNTNLADFKDVLTLNCNGRIITLNVAGFLQQGSHYIPPSNKTIIEDGSKQNFLNIPGLNQRQAAGLLAGSLTSVIVIIITIVLIALIALGVYLGVTGKINLKFNNYTKIKK